MVVVHSGWFKTSESFRGGYLKPVHQAGTLNRSLLKQQVSLYHNRVRERVRQGNQLLALLRRHGVFAKSADRVNEAEWQFRLKRLPAERSLHEALRRIREVFLLMFEQEQSLREELIGRAGNQEPVRRFQELPGIGWIRAVTFYAYIDTPRRFKSKAALWKYCGIGLERRHSGQGRVRTRLSRSGNRRLKDALLGAAKSAIAQAANPFADKYQVWTEEQGGKIPHARRNVARCLAAVLWGLWKTNQRYDPRQVVPNPTRP